MAMSSACGELKIDYYGWIMGQIPTEDTSAKTECRTPASDKNGVTRIPTWKYNAVREAILSAFACQKASSISFSELRVAAKTYISEPSLVSLGSWGWHFTTVKLNMEVEGEIERVKDSSPQQLVLKL